MKLSDAKKILSGELVPIRKKGHAVLSDKNGREVVIPLTMEQCKFALRQLALKVEREHKKARE